MFVEKIPKRKSAEPNFNDNTFSAIIFVITDIWNQPRNHKEKPTHNEFIYPGNISFQVGWVVVIFHTYRRDGAKYQQQCSISRLLFF